VVLIQDSLNEQGCNLIQNRRPIPLHFFALNPPKYAEICEQKLPIQIELSRMQTLSARHMNPKQSLFPFAFDRTSIEKAGVFELSNFRLACRSLMDILCTDIKSNKLGGKALYDEYSR
jgi:hypothetical protein